MTPSLTRRRLLIGATAAGVLAGVGGCSDGRNAVPPAAADPLEALIDAELKLVAAYDAAIAALSDQAAKLRPIRDEHAAHAQALRARLDPRRQAAVPATPAAPATATLAQLVAAEREAVTRATAACLAASDGRAALLASIAASEASHVAELS